MIEIEIYIINYKLIIIYKLDTRLEDLMDSKRW